MFDFESAMPAESELVQELKRLQLSITKQIHIAEVMALQVESLYHEALHLEAQNIKLLSLISGADLVKTSREKAKMQSQVAFVQTVLDEIASHRQERHELVHQVARTPSQNTLNALVEERKADSRQRINDMKKRMEYTKNYINSVKTLLISQSKENTIDKMKKAEVLRELGGVEDSLQNIFKLQNDKLIMIEKCKEEVGALKAEQEKLISNSVELSVAENSWSKLRTRHISEFRSLKRGFIRQIAAARKRVDELEENYRLGKDPLAIEELSTPQIFIQFIDYTHKIRKLGRAQMKQGDETDEDEIHEITAARREVTDLILSRDKSYKEILEIDSDDDDTDNMDYKSDTEDNDYMDYYGGDVDNYNFDIGMDSGSEDGRGTERHSEEMASSRPAKSTFVDYDASDSD